MNKIELWRKYFPSCNINGVRDPVEYGHLHASGCIPAKCLTCDYFFEGECLRSTDRPYGCMTLDHGPCNVPGDTYPVDLEINVDGKDLVIEIPEKCFNCLMLDLGEVLPLTCKSDSEVWGQFPRGLDWGDWKPNLEGQQENPPNPPVISSEIQSLGE